MPTDDEDNVDVWDLGSLMIVILHSVDEWCAIAEGCSYYCLAKCMCVSLLSTRNDFLGPAGLLH